MKKYASRTLSRALFLLLLMPAASLGPPAMATGLGAASGKNSVPSPDTARCGGPPGTMAPILTGAPILSYNKGAPPG